MDCITYLASVAAEAGRYARFFASRRNAQLARYAIACVAAPALGGCTLVCAGIGASTPRWSTVPDGGAVPYESDVRVETEQRQLKRHVSGKFLGFENKDVGGHPVSVIVLDTPKGERRIPMSKVSAVEVQDGSYWATGMAIGAAMDVAVVVVVAVELSQHPILSSGSWGDSRM